MNKEKVSNRDLLKEKVVNLVCDFVRDQGGITSLDLLALFGHPMDLGEVNQVASTLGKIPIVL